MPLRDSSTFNTLIGDLSQAIGERVLLRFSVMKVVAAIALAGILIASVAQGQTSGPDGSFGLVFRNLLAYKPSSLVIFQTAHSWY